MKQIVVAVALAVLVAGAEAACAGAVGGKGSRNDKVPANGFKAYHVLFKGGESATVKVESKHCTSLFLIIYDAKGKLQAFRAGKGGSMSATFTPPAQGAYRLVVKSNAGFEVEYKISHD